MAPVPRRGQRLSVSREKSRYYTLTEVVCTLQYDVFIQEALAQRNREEKNRLEAEERAMRAKREADWVTHHYQNVLVF